VYYLLTRLIPSSAVPYPPTEKLSEEAVFDENGLPKMDLLKSHFIAEGKYVRAHNLFLSVSFSF